MARRVLLGLVLLAGCDRGTAPPEDRPPPPGAATPATPAMHPSGYPLVIDVVEWSAADLAEAELAVREDRVLLVAGAGDQARWARECRGPSDASGREAIYTYRGTPPREEHTAQGGTTFDATVIGSLDVTRYPHDKRRLRGDCGDVTHVVRAIEIGAFVLASSVTTETKGEVPIGGGVVGGSTKSSTETSSRGGERSACVASTDSPPAKCRAFLRFHLDPLAP